MYTYYFEYDVFMTKHDFTLQVEFIHPYLLCFTNLFELYDVMI